MPSRKVLKNVLRGFLGTYVSRYSDLDGHLVFGLAVEALDGLEVDLLADASAPSMDPVKEIRRLAMARFAEQLAKVGLPRSVLRNARLSVVRTAASPSGTPGARGQPYTFTVRVETDFGRSYRADCSVFIAPNDPNVFSRSRRRGPLEPRWRGS